LGDGMRTIADESASVVNISDDSIGDDVFGSFGENPSGAPTMTDGSGAGVARMSDPFEEASQMVPPGSDPFEGFDDSPNERSLDDTVTDPPVVGDAFDDTFSGVRIEATEGLTMETSLPATTMNSELPMLGDDIMTAEETRSMPLTNKPTTAVRRVSEELTSTGMIGRSSIRAAAEADAAASGKGNASVSGPRPAAPAEAFSSQLFIPAKNRRRMSGAGVLGLVLFGALVLVGGVLAFNPGLLDPTANKQTPIAMNTPAKNTHTPPANVKANTPPANVTANANANAGSNSNANAHSNANLNANSNVWTNSNSNSNSNVGANSNSNVGTNSNTPVDPQPVDPQPVDPTPVDPTPVDPTPVDPTPVDPTPVDPTPVDPTPVDPTPVDPTPVDPTPVDPTPVDPTPVDPTPVDPTPVDPTPVDPTPVDPTPVDPTPVDPTPVDPTPVDPTPVDPTPTPDRHMIDLESADAALPPAVLNEKFVANGKTIRITSITRPASYEVYPPLPAGLTLDRKTGDFSGRPVEPANGQFTFRGLDQEGNELVRRTLVLKSGTSGSNIVGMVRPGSIPVGGQAPMMVDVRIELAESAKPVDRIDIALPPGFSTTGALRVRVDGRSLRAETDYRSPAGVALVVNLSTPLGPGKHTVSMRADVAVGESTGMFGLRATVSGADRAPQLITEMKPLGLALEVADFGPALMASVWSETRRLSRGEQQAWIDLRLALDVDETCDGVSSIVVATPGLAKAEVREVYVQERKVAFTVTTEDNRCRVKLAEPIKSWCLVRIGLTADAPTANAPITIGPLHVESAAGKRLAAGRARDNAMTLEVVEGPFIRPGRLANARKGRDYLVVFDTVLNTPTDWTIEGAAPPGLTFSDGVLAGEATTPGFYDFVVAVHTAEGPTLRKRLFLRVVE
ncbi:MAG: putative Ig domain-containing protein, partial [Planctomycetota bacterium]